MADPRLLEVDEELQLILKDSRRHRHGVIGRHGAVRRHFQGQLIVVGRLPDAGVAHLVGNLAHWRIDSVHGDQTDGGFLGPVQGRRHITLAGLDGQFHGHLGAVVEGANDKVRIHDLDVMAGLDGARLHLTRTLGLQGHALWTGAVHAQAHGLDVEDNVGDVLAHPGD